VFAKAHPGQENLVHQDRRLPLYRSVSGIALAVLMMSGSSVSSSAPNADDLSPQTPAAFMPGGMLGIQLGGSWKESKLNPSLQDLNCQAIDDDANEIDEVCFFRASSRVGGAEIHDGFIVRKGDHVVLVGTGISIKNAEDPVAESVMQSLQAQVHSAYQHTGDDVLFVKLPGRHMSADELLVFSRSAPVLLVQLESKTNELAVLYGYLAPVNAFGAMTSD
jgi:hypothetical protein